MKWPFSFPPHPMSASALPGKNTTDKICIKINKKNFKKFHLSRSVATSNQPITRFDSRAAAHLLNRPNIQEYWWIQEATGKVWIRLEQNVINAAINKWRKYLWAEPMFVGQHFKHFCRQLKNGQLDKLSAKMIKIWPKYVFSVLFWLSNTPKWLKCNVLFVFFPKLVQKQTLGEVGN